MLGQENTYLAYKNLYTKGKAEYGHWWLFADESRKWQAHTEVSAGKYAVNQHAWTQTQLHASEHMLT